MTNDQVSVAVFGPRTRFPKVSTISRKGRKPREVFLGDALVAHMQDQFDQLLDLRDARSAR